MPNALFEKMKWRLVDETGEGADVVTPVLSDDLTHDGDVQIETDVVATFTPEYMQHPEYLWTEEDFKLFLALYLRGNDRADLEHVEINLSDDWAQEAIHIVAAARFAPVLNIENLMHLEDVNTIRNIEYDITDMVAINTKYGFRLGVIVAIDSIEAHVVMLDPWQEDDELALGVHEQVLIPRIDLLPPEFAQVLPGEDAVLH